MSGGSFNYLYRVDEQDLTSRIYDVKEMLKTLRTYRFASYAVSEMQAIIDESEGFQKSIEAKLDALRDVWQAVEWHVSNDFGEGDVVEVLEKFNQKTKTIESALNFIASDISAIQFCQDNCLKVSFEWGNSEGEDADGSIESEWNWGNRPCVTVWTGTEIDGDLIRVDAPNIIEAVKRYINKAFEENHRVTINGREYPAQKAVKGC